MNIKKVFLLITLVLLFVGLSYASEVSNDTTTVEDTNTNIAKDTNTNIKVVNNVLKEETYDKKINKEINLNNKNSQ